MPFYESVYIARQDVTSAQVDGLTENFEKIITEQGGSVAKKESWGLRTLAYRIKKNRKGYYVLLNIDAPPAAIREMERQMQLNEDVLRFLTTRVEALEEGPSAVLKAKERGDDRDRGRGDDRGRRGGYDKDRNAKPKDTGEAKPKDADKPETPKKETGEAKPKDADKPETPKKDTGDAAAKDEKAPKDEKAEKPDKKDKDKDEGGDK